jgi:carbon storage regulator CsrA
MQILTIPFEEAFYVKLQHETVKIVTFTTNDPGIIKFGIEASRDVQIHREEIYESIKNQKKLSEVVEDIE